MEWQIKGAHTHLLSIYKTFTYAYIDERDCVHNRITYVRIHAYIYI